MAEQTRQRILTESLKLFAERGFDSVSVQDIASAVGIKAPSLYNHFKSKNAIIKAIVDDTVVQFDEFAAELSMHIEAPESDFVFFEKVNIDDLVEKVKNIFIHSFKDEKLSAIRKMMTIEQFRNAELSELYNSRFIVRMIDYHTGIFERLIAAGRVKKLNPSTLSLTYVSPILLLLGVADRQPEKFDECLVSLEAHVRLFFESFNRTKRCAREENPTRTQAN